MHSFDPELKQQNQG